MRLLCAAGVIGAIAIRAAGIAYGQESGAPRRIVAIMPVVFYGEEHVLGGRAAERDADAVAWFRRFHS